MTRRELTWADTRAIEQNLRGVVRSHFAGGDRKDDFSGDIFFEWLGDELIRQAWESPFSFLVFEKPKALDALERIDRALADLGSALSDAEMQPTVSAGLFGEMALRSIDLEGAKAFFKVARDVSVYRNAAKKFRRDLEASPFGRRTLTQFKAEEVGLVPGCRTVWLWGTGKPAPLKDLNRASKFAKFLADVIEACGLDGDEVSAFRAWAKEQRDRP